MKATLFFILAIFITLSAAVYQRMTGPTHPVRGKVEILGETVKYKLLRSHNSTDDAKIKFAVKNPDISGIVKLRRYKSTDEWSDFSLLRDDENLVASIPKQPPAGKVMYQISLFDGEKTFELTDDPIIIRFKGPVPAFILIPHILAMFLAMLFTARAGLEAIFKRKKLWFYSTIATGLLFVGGIILGPIVQKYAFGAFWTGWPFGHDLTDNKTAVAFIFWLIALWAIYKNKAARIWVIIGTIVLFAVYSIPHSALGSELDYTKIEAVNE